MRGSEWFKHPDIEEWHGTYRRQLSDGCGRLMDSQVWSLLSDTNAESPIEAMFVCGWYLLHAIDRMCVRTFCEKADLTLKGQVPVKCGGRTFRLDLCVVPRDPLIALAITKIGAPLRVAIELDGHEFHERTKEQVDLRNERDRMLQADGWKVVHFSGSEVIRDPSECADKVAQIAACQFEQSRAALARHLSLEW
jgi:hypothetical protein